MGRIGDVGVPGDERGGLGMNPWDIQPISYIMDLGRYCFGLGICLVVESCHNRSLWLKVVGYCLMGLGAGLGWR